MMDAGPPIWLPPPGLGAGQTKPAIIRPIEQKLLRPGFLPASRAERRAALKELIARKVITPEQAKWAIFGFLVPAVGWGAELPSSNSFIDSAESEASTITAPPSVISGDILVLLDRTNNTSGTPTQVVPSGFHIVSNLTTTTRRHILSYKLATGAEANATLTGMSGTVFTQKLIAHFRPNVPATNVVLNGAVDVPINDGDPSSITVSASGGDVPLIVIAAYNSSASVSPRNFVAGGSGAKDGETNKANNQLWIAWKFYDAGSIPADVVVDMEDEGNGNTLQGGYLVVG